MRVWWCAAEWQLKISFSDCRWYFGGLSREQANNILNERVDSGTFLVRDSSTMPGEYVLCVR